MARYVMLIKFTEKGIAAIKESPARAAAFKAAVAKAGGAVEAQLWTLGEYDGAVVFSAPSEDAATALALGVGALGSIRTTLCRAFNEAEFKAVLGKL